MYGSKTTCLAEIKVSKSWSEREETILSVVGVDEGDIDEDRESWMGNFGCWVASSTALAPERRGGMFSALLNVSRRPSRTVSATLFVAFFLGLFPLFLVLFLLMPSLFSPVGAIMDCDSLAKK